MKLGPKLLMAPLLTACIVLAIAAGSTLLQQRNVMQSHAALREDTESLRTITGAKDQLSQIHASVYRTVSLIGSLDDAKVKAFRASLVTQLDGLKRTFDGLASASSQAAGLSALGAQLDQYGKQADTAVDMSTVDPNTGIAAMQSADATFHAATDALGHVVSQMESGSFEAMEASAARSTRQSILLGLLELAVCVLAVALTWWLQRKVVSDLQQACSLADEVAGGNLAIEVRSTRRDEVGDLMRALGGMARQLNSSLTTVMQSSSSIRVASVDIAGGNQNLSKRTEQTANSLQHAASSMSQLTGTVKHSADSARQANELANSAAQVAARGGTVVDQVVSTMDEINASSKKIADIIGVIDGIAFQTNILALNAAVEAARAGEQGRGFAVVASEVRSLAQRSAQAAKEIKSLIGASVEKVETGSRLVHDAGATMREIVGSVQRVSHIIGEISSASGAQSQGIDRVSAAVTDLDQMTQQNAALVEQSAVAAENLRDQAGRLAQVVSTFQLQPAAAGEPSAAF